MRVCGSEAGNQGWWRVMDSIAMISQKGGSGKTTLALHVAVSVQAMNLNVAVIDLDPQASAMSWNDRRQDGALPVVISAHAKRLQQELQRVKDAGADLVIIDTAPHADSAALTAAQYADMVIVPCRASILDVETARTTLDLISASGTPAHVVMNASPAWGGDAKVAEEALREAGVSVLEPRVAQRLVFSRALLAGQCAQEAEPDSKAAKEVRALAQSVIELLDKERLQGMLKMEGRK